MNLRRWPLFTVGGQCCLVQWKLSRKVWAAEIKALTTGSGSSDATTYDGLLFADAIVKKGAVADDVMKAVELVRAEVSQVAKELRGAFVGLTSMGATALATKQSIESSSVFKVWWEAMPGRWVRRGSLDCPASTPCTRRQGNRPFGPPWQSGVTGRPPFFVIRPSFQSPCISFQLQVRSDSTQMHLAFVFAIPLGWDHPRSLGTRRGTMPVPVIDTAMAQFADILNTHLTPENQNYGVVLMGRSGRPGAGLSVESGIHVENELIECLRKACKGLRVKRFRMQFALRGPCIQRGVAGTHMREVH